MSNPEDTKKARNWASLHVFHLSNLEQQNKSEWETVATIPKCSILTLQKEITAVLKLLEIIRRQTEEL